MNDGAKIIRCQAWDGGGAVYVSGDGANFTMNGGVIGGNSAYTNVAKWGGGVYVGFCCEFTMSGNSEISYNMAEHTGSNSTGIHGGGVYFSAIFDSTFTMNDNAKITYPNLQFTLFCHKSHTVAAIKATTTILIPAKA